MALYKILQEIGSIEGWVVGDIVDITNPEVLLREGKIELANVEDTVKAVEPEVTEQIEQATKAVENFYKAKTTGQTVPTTGKES